MLFAVARGAAEICCVPRSDRKVHIPWPARPAWTTHGASTSWRGLATCQRRGQAAFGDFSQRKRDRPVFELSEMLASGATRTKVNSNFRRTCSPGKYEFRLDLHRDLACALSPGEAARRASSSHAGIEQEQSWQPPRSHHLQGHFYDRDLSASSPRFPASTFAEQARDLQTRLLMSAGGDNRSKK